MLMRYLSLKLKTKTCARTHKLTHILISSFAQIYQYSLQKQTYRNSQLNHPLNNPNTYNQSFFKIWVVSDIRNSFSDQKVSHLNMNDRHSNCKENKYVSAQLNNTHLITLIWTKVELCIQKILIHTPALILQMPRWHIQHLMKLRQTLHIFDMLYHSVSN